MKYYVSLSSFFMFVVVNGVFRNDDNETIPSIMKFTSIMVLILEKFRIE